MTTYETSGQEGNDVEKRTLRAATESITLLENGPRVEGADGLYEAVPQSGGNDDRSDTYIVDARLVSCECPDHEYREPEGGCKHLRRLKLIKGELALPEEIPEEDVHGRIGIGISDGRTIEDLLEARAPATDTPAKAVADGGIVVTDDDGEVLEESEDSEDCECHLLPGEYPCAACYTEGDAEWPEGEDNG